MNTDKIRKYILLGMAVFLTVTALGFTALAFFMGRAGRYVETLAFATTAVLSFWGAPFAYYGFAVARR